MPFGFFKKRGGKHRDDDDLFDPTEDDLEFDVLESSSPYIEDANYAPPPPPPAPPPPARPHHAAPPPPPRQAAPRPAPPRPAPPPAARRPAPPPPSTFDDLTIIDKAPRGAAPGAPVIPPPAAPVPPSQARPTPAAPRPRPAAPPPPPQAAAPAPPAPHAAPPPAAPPRRPAPPHPDGPPDVTMVMSGPVGAECLVAWLVVATGPERGTDHRLPGGTARIGHGPGCDVRLAADTYISSCHAEISFRGGVYVLTDLDSTNGSFVNEARVDEAVLHDGDRVRLGVTQLVFKSFSL